MALEQRTLADVQSEVAWHMDEIAQLFVAGAKVTVLVRFQDHPKRDFMMTADAIPELRAMLDRREAEAS